MNTENTTGTWFVRQNQLCETSSQVLQIFSTPSNQWIADCGHNANNQSQANAKRIVDCVNAFEGIDNPSEFIEELKDAFYKLQVKYKVLIGSHLEQYKDLMRKHQELQKKLEDIENTKK